ncbi:ACP S-malonyltransferase [Halalkalibacter sp. APA_J-10(15)]|uniref:ACP S-malonyltransferase n=1 Tax=Halalkalibacter sp. APA_J-10(15) TaxID=2933805 RepID=UPI001FF5E483|nr:ACP S-malonyltransferase [Halalkalibacter sp. APA_J-10(15)]MCK0471881.1 ACP S-malonyltransferase [Halalkalibacter sp. APA_J-10(15)]
MNKKIIFLFPGHGSQYYMMGKELYDSNKRYKRILDELDVEVKKLLGASVLEELYHQEKAGNSFKDFKYTHFANFMIEYAMGKILIEQGIEPDYIIGSSLGELVALTISEAISLRDMLQYLYHHITFLREHCNKGHMITVYDDVSNYYEDNVLASDSYLAGINFDGNYVISCRCEDVDNITNHLKSLNVLHERLPIEYPFHCELVDLYIDNTLGQIRDIQIRKPKYPLISSVDGMRVTNIDIEYFRNILRKPILFKEAILNLKEKEEAIYIDLGPTGNMINFTKKIVSNHSMAEFYTILTPFKRSKDNYHRLIGELADRKKEERDGNMIVYIFPGQGSQQVGMGKELFDKYEDVLEIADRILGYSLKELCLYAPNHVLNLTQYTQPAIFVVNHLYYLEKIKNEEEPHFVAGHSLGECNALVAAKVLDFSSALELVKKRAEMMSQADGGAMAVISGIPAEQVEEIIKENELRHVFISNYNSTIQTVIAGGKEEVNNSFSLFNHAGARVIPLNVSGAFHSTYMTNAKHEFRRFINKFEFNRIEIPIISNLTARPYIQEDIKDTIANQIDNPLKWVDSIRYLLARDRNIHFEQIGDGNFLLGFIDNIKDNTTDEILSRYHESDEIDALFRKEIKNNQANIGIGSKEFMQDYNLIYPYIAGGMYRGIASEEMVVRMAQFGMLGFYGSGGLKINEIESTILNIKERVGDKTFGVNFVHTPDHPEKEREVVNCFLKNGVTLIEAAAFMEITENLVRYRIQNLQREQGEIKIKNRIIAKVSRPEIAEMFLSPPPYEIVNDLYNRGEVSFEQLELSQKIPMADDITVESDSGGHTDQGVSFVTLPTIMRLRDRYMNKYRYTKAIRVGAAGGIGTPEAIAASFILGAEYIVTGSINQCTVEARTSSLVKEILQEINIQDTDYAPAGDMFEFGAKVQVVKKGLFFSARANKLYELYRQYNSLEDIDEEIRKQIENKYFKRSFESVWEEIENYQSSEVIERANINRKYKMSLLFKWYLFNSTKNAINGIKEDKVNFQIHCGSAMGAFNQWVKGTDLTDWRNRHVDEIGMKLMEEAIEILESRLKNISA